MSKKKSLSEQWLDAGIGNLLRPPKSVERVVMKSSPMLLEFYKWWYNITPIPGHLPRPTSGLCTNLAIYAGLRNISIEDYDTISKEMNMQFAEAGLIVRLPFNKDIEDYSKESHRSACYSNSARVQWVKDRIQESEE